MSFSKEQLRAFDLFQQGNNVFLTGPGGTGKTHLIHHMIQYCESVNASFQVCAMTGCAAVLLGGGTRTLHSWSGIGLGTGPLAKIQQKVLYNKKAATRWKKTNILIVDEVSMMSKKIFDTIEHIARQLRKKPGVFGGMQLIFCGDFFQLPPVGNADEPDSDLFCFQSEHWFNVFPQRNHVQLTHIFRQDDDQYKKILHHIRWGELDKESAEILAKQIGKEIDPENVPTKLYAVRAKTDFVNMNMYAKLAGEEYVYEMVIHTEMMIHTDMKSYADGTKLIDRAILDQRNRMNTDEVAAEVDVLMNATNRPKMLRLKKGARVMCLHNYDLDRGLCNGAQGTIVDFVPNDGSPEFLPIVRFSNGIRMKIGLIWQQSEEMPCIGIGQLPLCLAWALTIHKIQGATLSMAEMDLGNSVFEFGQTYVSLSRVRNLKGLYISALNTSKIKANPIVKEFYKNLSEQEQFSAKSEEDESETSSTNIFQKFANSDPDLMTNTYWQTELRAIVKEHEKAEARIGEKLARIAPIIQSSLNIMNEKDFEREYKSRIKPVVVSELPSSDQALRIPASEKTPEQKEIVRNRGLITTKLSKWKEKLLNAMEFARSPDRVSQMAVTPALSETDQLIQDNCKHLVHLGQSLMKKISTLMFTSDHHEIAERLGQMNLALEDIHDSLRN